VVRDESLRRWQHPLVGSDEPLGGLRLVGHRAEHWVAYEAQERVDRALRDIGDRSVRRSSEREEFGERESAVEQRQPGPHGLRVGCRVAGDPVRVDVVGEQEPRACDRLEQRHARTDLRREGLEVEWRVGVVGARRDRCRESRVRSGGRVHAPEGRPSSVGSLPGMSSTESPPERRDIGPADGTPAGAPARAPLPAAGRDGKDAALVQSMFDRVAPRYDVANTVLSLGQDANWRRVTAAAARPEGARVLDVAAGPGNVSVELVRQGADGVVALDLSFNMLHEGARRGHVGIAWVNGDALALPFPDASFDAVTISFGLRNVPDPEAALAEFARVTRPGGRVVVCEFAEPTWAPFREVYRRYLVGALPRVARVVSSNAPAYRYLADSILAWPDRRTLAGWIDAAGYDEVRVRDLSGGIVAVHRGVRR
jgi:demethylmenaquinone methyltransferase/2-methoxy-6-polyprenyl-1,4-benzoquinol methylase